MPESHSGSHGSGKDGRTASRRSVVLLVMGATVGLALVAVELAKPERTADVDGTVAALINGVPLSAEEYGATLTRFAESRDGMLTRADSTKVLDALIGEELLVQRARELGVDRNDRLVRDLLSKTVAEMEAMKVQAAEIADEDVAKFFAEHPELFGSSPRVRAREIRIGVNDYRSGDGAERRATEAVSRLRAGEDFATVSRQVGDRPVDPVPNRLLREEDLRRLVGANVAAKVFAMEPGSISDPLSGESDFHVFEVRERVTPPPPPLKDVEDRVRSELSRRRQNAAVEALVQRLRDDADIQVRVP